MRRYNPELASRPQLVAANKCDIIEDMDSVHKFREYIMEHGCKFFEISAAANTGVRNSGIYDRLEEMGIKEGDTVSIYNLEFEYAK